MNAIIAICVLLVAEAILAGVLITIGCDKSPGSWGDLVTLIFFNPAGHFVFATTALIVTTWKRRAIGTLPCFAAVLIPLAGAFIVHNVVYGSHG